MLSAIWKLIGNVVSLFKSKPTWADAVPMVVNQLLPMVNYAIEYGGMDSKEKFDAWLDGIDVATGEDAGALVVMGGVPRDKAEVFWDHIIAAARVIGYSKLGIEEYTA